MLNINAKTQELNSEEDHCQRNCSCRDDKCSCEPQDDHGCSCCSGCENESEVFRSKLFITGVILFILGICLSAMRLQLPTEIFGVIYFISYLLIAKEILLTAGRNILRGQVFDENFLMVIASLGAFIIGEYPEAVAAMLFYRIGEHMQDRAVARSRKSISGLLDIRPDIANKKTENGIETVAAESIRVDDVIVIKAGEKVPLDGEVIEGSSTMDTRALTGESLPRDVAVGSSILSGSINGQGLLSVKVTKEFSESTATKIIELVQNASSKKAKTENFITKFARYYTPAVVGIALALAVIPPFILNLGYFSEWLYRALVFLVVSCPCALVISIPLGFFGGIGAASSHGILVKGSNYLEALNAVDTVVFDKTGTLTSGVFHVSKINSSEGFTEGQVLELGAYAENHSTHPIAASIIKKYCSEPGREIDESRITALTERAGFGIKAEIDGKTVLAGNARLMQGEGILLPETEVFETMVYIAVDGNFAGSIEISDEAKKDSKASIEGLRAVGVKRIAMLTGDHKKIGEKIGKELGIQEIYADLLPHQKVEALESIFESNQKRMSGKSGKIIFVGDGINDAPVLARADIGIAMGGVGSDAAIEAADIVIMNDEISRIITAIRIAEKTRKIVVQNITFALGIKGIVLLLGALGMATLWEAVFADVGVALLAVLNSVRAGHIDG